MYYTRYIRDDRYYNLCEKIYDAIVDNVFFGDDEFAKECDLEVKYKDTYEDIEITISAEMDYDDLNEACDIGNRYIHRFDDEAYFEPADSGFAIAYIRKGGKDNGDRY